MQIRMIGLPWWARWVCTSALMSLVLGPLMLIIPAVDFSPVWAWAPIGMGVAIAGASIAYQEKAHRAYLAVLDSVSDSQRADVVKALWRRHIPADPVVLRWAIELGETLSKLRKDSSSLSTPVIWSAMALLQVYITHSFRTAAGWTLLAVLLMFAFMSEWFVSRRQERHIAVLRAAETGQPEDPGPLLERRDWLWLAVIAATLVMCAIGLTATYEREWPRRDCEQTHEAIMAVNERNWLTNGQLIVQGGPSVADYEVWSDQLQREADKMSSPDVAARVRHIADLSVQVTEVVRSAHAAAPTSSTAEVADREAAYQKLIVQMLDEVKAVKAFCWGG